MLHGSSAENISILLPTFLYYSYQIRFCSANLLKQILWSVNGGFQLGEPFSIYFHDQFFPLWNLGNTFEQVTMFKLRFIATIYMLPL